ncbi:50S ribosomal protein L6 [Thioalkalivibrio paradoxus]|uniref:Large ribosomal subunit protein uL6 n=1 Tax=Thioalkalivibrio paradoxus ARh 1 TaxID=713585 RepID=W0DQV8_9GAMM|nr:50S ribosomal protein L6 [Thioalkalivibrio paradoxus]AHE99230.1 50S ribosomal protein L6 [Thioalkalivibrio paradoxus ARh 1]
MSRVAKRPLALPSGVTLQLNGQEITVKGPKGTIAMPCPDTVEVSVDGSVVSVAPAANAENSALAGTVRALLGNHVQGVSQGFERGLELVGVGYRAQAQGKVLNLNLGFSHPIAFEVPEGVTIETPSQTEIVVKGHDCQQVGQVAANIRAFRPPEPYKGKGVKYKGERILRKEAKKK